MDDRRPGPGLARHGQLVDERFTMLAFAADAPAPDTGEPGSRPLWDYLAALSQRDELMAGWDQFFDAVDVLLALAMPMCAWPVNDEPADEDPQVQAMATLMLSQASGCPMIVIPAGTDSNGVPFGAQLMDPAGTTRTSWPSPRPSRPPRADSSLRRKGESPLSRADRIA